eukprot:356531-Chlamydomonas_euryale.AAC.1
MPAAAAAPPKCTQSRRLYAQRPPPPQSPQGSKLARTCKVWTASGLGVNWRTLTAANMRASTCTWTLPSFLCHTIVKYEQSGSRGATHAARARPGAMGRPPAHAQTEPARPPRAATLQCTGVPSSATNNVPMNEQGSTRQRNAAWHGKASHGTAWGDTAQQGKAPAGIATWCAGVWQDTANTSATLCPHKRHPMPTQAPP